MTKEHFVQHFLSCFEKDFAEKKATEIQKQALQEMLVNVLREVIYSTSDFIKSRKKTERDQITFRCAYLFETLYFKDKNIILLFLNPSVETDGNDFAGNNFAELLSAVTNESVKRHFGKILTDVLKNNVLTFSENDYELLAETVASWAVAPRTRVAVQIWAFEILLLLREKVNISEETIGYLLEILSQDSSPAMKCRLRRWCVQK